MSINPYDIARILGGERVLGSRIRTLAQLRRAVLAGLPVARLARVAEHVAAYPAAAAELKYGIVPKATLHRRRTRLSPEESERLERLARVNVVGEAGSGGPGPAHGVLSNPPP